MSILTALLLLCFHEIKASSPMKIGFINTFTGKNSQIGENLTNGAAMAVEDLRTKGIQVSLINEDDGGDPRNALAAFEKLATIDRVVGIVGPYSSSSANVVASMAEQYQVPLLIPAAAKQEITMKGYRNVFRLNAPADVYSSVLLNAVASFKPKTIAYVYVDTDFGVSTVKTARQNAAKMGLREVAYEKYQQEETNFMAILSRVKAAKPDLVFLVSYDTDAILLMKQAKKIALTPKAFLGAGAGYTTLQFAQQKDISNLVMCASQWTDDANWPGAAEFALRYKAKFGKEATYHSACAYEAVRIMSLSASKSSTSRDLCYSLETGRWEGILGPVEFASYAGFTNQNIHQMLVQQIQDGRYETVYPVQFAVMRLHYPFRR